MADYYVNGPQPPDEPWTDEEKYDALLIHNDEYFTGDYYIRHHHSIGQGSFGAWPITVVFDLDTMTVIARSETGVLSAEDVLAAVNAAN